MEGTVYAGITEQLDRIEAKLDCMARWHGGRRVAVMEEFLALGLGRETPDHIAKAFIDYHELRPGR